VKEIEAIRKFLEGDHPSVQFVKSGVASGLIGCTDDVPPEQPVTVVGAPKTDINGSKAYTCGECGGRVWLAPSAQEMMAKRTGPIHIVCISCVVKELNKNAR
jgi:hypothetical protein